jgi:hypothetical protein
MSECQAGENVDTWHSQDGMDDEAVRRGRDWWQGAASIADANDAHAKQSQAGYNNYDTADDCGWNGSLAQTKILRR